MRVDDFFRDGANGATLDVDLLRSLRTTTSPRYTDVEAAIALARLLHDQFLAYGTAGGESITDTGSREALRTLIALADRLGISFAPPYRDFGSFRSYWQTHDGHGSWQARRVMLFDLFEPLHVELEEREDASLRGDLAEPISPRGNTGWAAVDEEIAELRRHFHSASTVQDYRNVGNDIVTVLEALSAAAYDPTRHLYEGETEPPVTQTKNRLGRIVEVDFPAEGSDELVKLAKDVAVFAQAVKHNPDGSRVRAGIAADAVIQLANMIRRIQA